MVRASSYLPAAIIAKRLVAILKKSPWRLSSKKQRSLGQSVDVFFSNHICNYSRLHYAINHRTNLQVDHSLSQYSQQNKHRLSNHQLSCKQSFRNTQDYCSYTLKRRGRINERKNQFSSVVLCKSHSLQMIKKNHVGGQARRSKFGF